VADEMMPAAYAKRVGERLRAIRLQKGHSLHDVEDASTKEFKASVLGAYERGERSVSVPRLQRLAMFYGVPVDQLLPRLEPGPIVLDGQGRPADGGIRLDLARLREVQSPEIELVARYADQIQMARGDFNGRVLTLRADDLRVLAAAADSTPAALAGRLEELGVRSRALV
jgi:transcriptional regulator with XRE-family HTH domain